MIDKRDKTYKRGELIVPVYVINDLQTNWKGQLTLSVYDKDTQINTYSTNLNIESNSKAIQSFRIDIPQKPGNYLM